ncbi:MAG: HU family DNA-binding protein [Planctomycetota bacterium]
MDNIHKRSLINRIAEGMDDSQDNIKKIIDSFTAEMLEHLKEGQDIEFRGFGVFRVKNRPGRKGINPKTQEKVEIAAKKHVHFKMGNVMSERVKVQP